MNMKHIYLATFLLICCQAATAQTILVFSKTNGYRHQSIETGIRTLDSLAQSLGYQIYFSEDSLDISAEKLNAVDVLIFLSTSGDILNEAQQIAVEDFMKQGKGFIGIHGASATEYDWNWYVGLVGSFFVDHPSIQHAKLYINKDDPIFTDLPQSISIEDEWYNFSKPFPNTLKTLITIDETTYQGGTMGDFHPSTWYHEYGGGRAFYTSLGHRNETFANKHFRSILIQAIKWTSGQ